MNPKRQKIGTYAWPETEARERRMQTPGRGPARQGQSFGTPTLAKSHSAQGHVALLSMVLGRCWAWVLGRKRSCS